MRQKTGSYLALGALLLLRAIEARASEPSEARMTILVYDYIPLDDETLRASEDEAGRIFQHAGVKIAWRHCYPPRTGTEIGCPNPAPATPAVRLVAQFHPVAGLVRADTMGFWTGDMATVSFEEIEKVSHSGAGPVTEILGLSMAHEIGHVLLGGAHSASGIMRARWGQADWTLASQGKLVFLPRQATALRKELRIRSETAAANGEAR
jgi:hypothetical protein